MAAKQLDIMKIKQLVLLKSKGVSNRKAAGQISADRNIVNLYVRQLESSGLSYDELLSMDEHELKKLFPTKEAVYIERYQDLHKLFPHYHNELKKPGCTRKRLWLTYKQEHMDHYSYSQFCQLFSDWQENKDVSGKLFHIAGDKLLVDFTGKKLSIVDKSTGEITEVEVFVALLPCSSYTYVEACMDQSRESLVNVVCNALHYFGGVPKCIVTDNLKAAVSRASKYEPVLNKTFRDLGLHYNCVINPTRTYSPKDKAMVEGAVKLVYQRIFYEISKMTFFSLGDLNKQIRIFLERYNSFKMETTQVSRAKQFINLEKEYLSPLPGQPYQIKYYNRAKVQKMGYIYLSERKNYYSVPYRYISKRVEVQHTSKTVEIYYNKQRIATHAKSYKKGEYVTLKDHLASTHQYYLSWSREFFVKKAAQIGINTATYIGKLIDQQQYPEIGYKRAQGIVNGLVSTYSGERVETACQRALEYHTCSFRTVEYILKNRKDQEQLAEKIEHKINPHKNLRDASNYK